MELDNVGTSVDLNAIMVYLFAEFPPAVDGQVHCLSRSDREQIICAPARAGDQQHLLRAENVLASRNLVRLRPGNTPQPLSIEENIKRAVFSVNN